MPRTRPPILVKRLAAIAWRADGIPFVVFDTKTVQDVGRVLLA